MKYLRVTARADPDRAPEFFTRLADSPEVAEAQVLDCNSSPEGVDTVLLSVDGDPRPFRDAALDTPGIESVTLSATDRGRTYALLETRPLSTPMFDTIHRARTRPGIAVRTPIVYRDGHIYFRVVGDPETLQAALDHARDAIDVRIDEIGTVPGELDAPGATLSDRQREAVEVALGLGYYDVPRGATHEEVAAELGCAPTTASEHLQKAEAKVIRATMGEFGSGV